MVQKDSQNDIWHEVSKTNWKFSFDELNKSIHIEFINAVKSSSLKIHNNWDDRNLLNVSHDNFATFKNTNDKMIRVWFLENERNESYSYDKTSNRDGLTVDGIAVSGIEYYKNNMGGNTPMIKFDGEWYYTYDENGNRISKGKSKTEVGSSYVEATATSNGAREGNVVINTSDEYWTYEWDLYNRLVKVKQFNAPDGDSCKEVSYEYDALNFRTKRTSVLEGTVTEYAYGRNGALTYEKFTKNGTTAGSRTYAYLNDQIIGFTDSVGSLSSKRYAVTDIQGSVNEIYNEEGSLLWKSGYTAFGELAGESVDKLEGVFEFHGMYTGCQIDVETGLTYHWNRWRGEDGSSFITQDPARDGSNWYGYCGQNPINRYDPSGLNWMDREGNWHSNSEPGINYNVGDKTPNGPQGETGPTETPKVPETPKETDTTQPNDLNCDLFAAGYDNEGNLWLFFIIDGVYKSQKAKIKKQNEIERKYGYSNLLCYVTSTLNMYISDGVVNESFIDNDLGKILDKHLNKDKTSKDYGALDDFNHFSNDIAKALGLDRYYEFIYKNKQEMKLFSEEEFYNLKRPDNSSMLDYGKYGIGWFHNSSVTEHHMLYRKETRDRINPSNNDNYTLDYIQPVFSQIINLF